MKWGKTLYKNVVNGLDNGGHFTNTPSVIA